METSDESAPNEGFEFSLEEVVIDPYNCDLNLVVDKECLLAYPLSNDGFCSMWAGCRATFGVNNGKVAFEVHLEDYCECTDLPKDDLEPYLIRIGWSLNRSSLQLGESCFSYAFCSNGKKCCDKIFEDYGEVFEKGDSIASYLDFDTDKENIIMSFSKNGIDLGIGFKISRSELIDYFQENYGEENFVLFPHVLSKNVVFEMNFGQRVSLIGDEPFAPIKSGFELIQKLPLEKRFRNEPTIKNKKDYEIIMMIGLPGCGKTYWANEYIKKNLKKNYYLIGVSSILEKMKMLGLKKKANPNQTGEFTVINNISSSSASKVPAEILDKILKCINVLIEIAAQSYRNIIIDQANVYISTRRRKLKIFEQYTRKAVVLVLPDNVYKERLALAEKEDGREIPVNLINDMKISFTLPNAEDFDSIDYAVLKEDDALRLVESYNSQGYIDRLELLLARRAKKNEEKRKSLSINPALLMRPIYRPNFAYTSGLPNTSSQTYQGNRFGARYNTPPTSNAFYPRRPLSHNFPNQYPRPVTRYPGTVPIDLSNPYVRAQSMVFNNYMGVVQPGMGIGLGPGQQPVLTQQQWTNVDYNQQNNWAPALPVPYQGAQQQILMMPGQQLYQSNPQYTNPIAPQGQNNWDPVVSTNLSQAISSSAFVTNLTNLNSTNQGNN